MIGLGERGEFGQLLPAATDGIVPLASGRPQQATEARRASFARAAVVGVGAAMALSSLIVAPGAAGLFGCALALLMLAIAAVDARCFIIPNAFTIAAFLLGLAHAASQSLASAPAGAAAAGLRGILLGLAFLGLREAYRRLRKRQGLGLGDVKLAAVAGAWLDFAFIPAAIEIATLAALVVYGLGRLIAHRPLRSGARLPFGLFFAPAIWICWLLEAASL